MTVWTAIVTSQVFAITLRILLSIGLGALIGLERQLRARSAGIRTNALVSLGSCLFTTVASIRSRPAPETPRAWPRRWRPASASSARA